MTTQQTDPSRDLPTGTWRLDPSQTTVTVTAKKLGLLTVPATLTLTSGTIKIDADHQLTAVEVVVDASSYTSKNAKRNVHVVSADFLDAATHPELRFKAGDISRTAFGFRADGSMTVKGQACPISVDVTDVEFDARAGSFLATATIDRTAIGVDKFPSLLIGRVLHLTVTATALIVEGCA